MHAPQAITLMLYLATLLIGAHEHGSPKTGKWHFGYSAFSVAMWLGLLYWGGFFRG